MRTWISWTMLACGLVGTGACGPAVDPVDETGMEEEPVRVVHPASTFVFGVDLSYVNQILDHGGSYADAEGVRDPYAIFADHGANAVRLRLWHDPSWVRSDVYADADVPLYSGLDDVVRAARSARDAGMQVNLDLHYSDIWADPSRQDVPAAWRSITELAALEDSVHAYTRGVLERLASEGLLPEMVQVGNEINRGMLSTEAPDGFPRMSVEEGHWAAQGAVLNAGIRAVREVAPQARVILHVAQPENVESWFDAITTTGGVSDFDILGLSYYSRWSEVELGALSAHVARFRERYGAEVMVVETAYPWTTENADSYGNIFGPGDLEPGYPATPAGQLAYLRDLVEAVADGGGRGVFLWEPAWITSAMRDLWGTGSSWENNTLFDFDGRAHRGMDWMTLPYDFSGAGR